MPRSHPHSKKSGGEGAREAPTPAAGEARTPAAGEVSAEDLRRQVALLAEQVRRLGQTADSKADAGAGDASRADAGAGAAGAGAAGRAAAGLPPAADPVHSPLPRPRAASPPPPAFQSTPIDRSPVAPHATAPIDRPFVERSAAERAALETAQVEQLLIASARGGASAAHEPGVAGAGGETASAPIGEDSFAERSSRLVASVLALAELAAIEIRASAAVEAAAIRAQASEGRSAAATAHLLTLLERQRHMLAALAAQTERLEQTSDVLRAQIRAIEAEHEHLSEMVSTGRRTL